MKKTFKSFFCVPLSVIIAFSALSVFAAAQGENFVWCDAAYYYAGEAKLGDNSFTVSNDCLSFDFNVEKSGYYYVTLDYYQGDYNIGDISVPLTYDEETYDEKDSYYSYDDLEDNDLEKYIFKFGEGREKLLFNLFYEGLEMTENSPLKFNVKYLGEEITGIEINNGTDKNIIYGYDLQESGYDDESEYEFYYSLRCDYDVFFGEESKLEFADNYLSLGSDEWVEKGEHTFYAEFFDYEEDITLSLYHASDFVEKIEFVGVDFHCKQFYNGGCIFVVNQPEEDISVEVTYKDGTKKTFDGGRITLNDNGREYYWYIDYSMYEDGAVVVVEVAGEVISRYPCEVVNASYEENLEELKFLIGDMIYSARMNVEWAFEEVSYAETLWERFTATRDAIIFAGDAAVITFANIIEEISLFMANI